MLLSDWRSAAAAAVTRSEARTSGKAPEAIVSLDQAATTALTPLMIASSEEEEDVLPADMNSMKRVQLKPAAIPAIGSPAYSSLNGDTDA